MGIITLVTDFGNQDEYVGVIKGVMLSINPEVTIVDICHRIPPRDIDRAGEMLEAAFKWFPDGTIHLAVVDPGVGSDRDILALRHCGHLFIAPNNGLLTSVLHIAAPEHVVKLENPEYYLHPVSSTFHGRDVFAPVAAHLSLGRPLEELGPTVGLDHIHLRPIEGCAFRADNQIIGQVRYVDRFGNLGTNIDIRSLKRLMGSSQPNAIDVEVCGRIIHGIADTYAQSIPGGLAALVNSRDLLEIAVNGGNASDLLAAGPGTVVRVVKKDLNDSGKTA